MSNLPLVIAEDGKTDITGQRIATNIDVVKEGNVITFTVTLQGGVVFDVVMTLDEAGALPISIKADGLEAPISWSDINVTSSTWTYNGEEYPALPFGLMENYPFAWISVNEWADSMNGTGSTLSGESTGERTGTVYLYVAAFSQVNDESILPSAPTVVGSGWTSLDGVAKPTFVYINEKLDVHKYYYTAGVHSGWMKMSTDYEVNQAVLHYYYRDQGEDTGVYEYPIWANFDMYDDFQVYVGDNLVKGEFSLPASEPTGTTKGLVLSEFLTGFALGLCGKPLPFMKKPPIGYSYNGTVLPKLPEWDREMYPYATLWEVTGTGNYLLYVSASELYSKTNTYIVIPQGVGHAYYRYMPSRDDFAWSHVVEVPDGNSYDESWWASTPWANYDLKYEDGTVRVPASEPIPVYKIVGYNYNGVVLPKLPEWDKEAYPYAVIYEYEYSGLAGTSHYIGLLCSKSPFVWQSGYQSFKTSPTDTYAESTINLLNNETEWSEIVEKTAINSSYIGTGDGTVAIWTNHDVVDSTDSTSVYLSASDPVPVYE